MAKFLISREQLLAQLPQKAGYSLIQDLDEMPKQFTFDGIAEAVDNTWNEHPEIREKLTPIEWQYFRLLINGGRVSKISLKTLSRPQERGMLLNPSNIVDVHIKNLRQAIAGRFSIKTYRAPNGTQDTIYIMSPINTPTPAL